MVHVMAWSVPDFRSVYVKLVATGVIFAWVMVIAKYVPAWAAVSVVWTGGSVVLRAVDVETDMKRSGEVMNAEDVLVVLNAAAVDRLNE